MKLLHAESGNGCLTLASLAWPCISCTVVGTRAGEVVGSSRPVAATAATLGWLPLAVLTAVAEAAGSAVELAAELNSCW